MDSYKKLEVKPSLGWWLRYYINYYTGVVLWRVPLLAKIALRIGYNLINIGNSGKDHARNLKYIKQLRSGNNSDQSAQFGSPYGYEDEFVELTSAVDYCNQLKRPNFKNEGSESAVLYEHAINKLSQIFDKGKVKGFVNFGVSYGYIDSILAKKYPQSEFIGIDRSRFTKLYNESQFSEIKNLKFGRYAKIS